MLNAMTAAAQEIGAEEYQGWIRHARRLHDIECDVDEAMWAHHQDRRESINSGYFCAVFCILLSIV